MPRLQHPAPAPVHGLLTVKRGGQFSKRIRRLARLENAVLELRLHENDPVEWSASLIDTNIQSDSNNLCITITAHSFRLKLYPHTYEKFKRWVSAFQASSLWKLSNYYQVFADQILGEGQFATVKRAVHRGTRDVVAVKSIRATLDDTAGSHPYLSELITRECRISRLISHDTIVNVRDVFEAPGNVYIVMEFMPYTLNDLIRVHTIIPEKVAARIVYQLLRGIAYLHEENIVHRDVKPDNVLCADLSANPEVKLCDFGMANFPSKRVEVGLFGKSEGIVAKRTRSSEHKIMEGDENTLGPFNRPMHLRHLTDHVVQSGVSGVVEVSSGVLEEVESERTNRLWSAIDGQTLTSAVGAPSYAAPELVKGHRYGKPVDIWGVGVLLFYMLTGYLPFEGDDAREVLEKISICEPDFDTGSWGRVSPSARNLVQALMQADPRKRMTAESALENEWLVRNCRGKVDI